MTSEVLDRSSNEFAFGVDPVRVAFVAKTWVAVCHCNMEQRVRICANPTIM